MTRAMAFLAARSLPGGRPVPGEEGAPVLRPRLPTRYDPAAPEADPATPTPVVAERAPPPPPLPRPAGPPPVPHPGAGRAGDPVLPRGDRPPAGPEPRSPATAAAEPGTPVQVPAPPPRRASSEPPPRQPRPAPGPEMPEKRDPVVAPVRITQPVPPPPRVAAPPQQEAVTTVRPPGLEAAVSAFPAAPASGRGAAASLPADRPEGPRGAAMPVAATARPVRAPLPPPNRGRVEATAEPRVQVTINRVEIRAAAPAPTPARRVARSAPVMSLDDYLLQRGRT